MIGILGQRHELGHGHRNALERVEGVLHRRRHLALRGTRSCCRARRTTMALTFGFLIAVSQPGPPLCECVTRMPGPILSNRADTPSDDNVHVERSGVRRHRAEVLVQGLGIARELDAVEVVRPDADAELVEPQLLVRRRLDGRLRPCCARHRHAAAGRSDRSRSRGAGRCSESLRARPASSPRSSRTGRHRAT